MQPYVFPYIGYYQLLNAVDKFVLLDDVNFIKGGWINRNRLLVNNEAGYFTVPLKRMSSTTHIKDAVIDDEGQKRWRKHVTSRIANCYQRAPFFTDVFPLVETVFLLPTVSISEMAASSLSAVSAYLGITTPLILSSSLPSNAHLKGQDRVIDTCVREGASVYVNAIGGQALYSRGEFIARGIDLRFLKSHPIEYPQLKNEFVPGLSIVDVLMFNSRSSVQQWLRGCELI